MPLARGVAPLPKRILVGVDLVQRHADTVGVAMRGLRSVRRDRLFGREKEEAVSRTSRQASLVAHNLKANEQLASKMGTHRKGDE